MQKQVKIVVIAHGVTPALSHPGVSNRAFSKMPLDEKFSHARYESLDWLKRVDVYYDCVCATDNDRLVSLLAYKSKFYWPDIMLDDFIITPTWTLDRNSIAIAGSLATLVILRQRFNMDLHPVFVASGIDIVAKHPGGYRAIERTKLLVDKTETDFSELSFETKPLDDEIKPAVNSVGKLQSMSAPLASYLYAMKDLWNGYPLIYRSIPIVKDAFDKFWTVVENTFEISKEPDVCDEPFCGDKKYRDDDFCETHASILMDGHGSEPNSDSCHYLAVEPYPLILSGYMSWYCCHDNADRCFCRAPPFCSGCFEDWYNCTCEVNYIDMEPHMFRSVTKAQETLDRVDDFTKSVQKADLVNRASNLLGDMEERFTGAVKFVEQFFRKQMPDLFSQFADIAILIGDCIRALFEESLYGFFSCMARIAIKMGIPNAAIRAFQKWTTAPDKNMSASYNKLADTVTVDGCVSMEGHGFEAPMTLMTIVGLFVMKRMPGVTDLRNVSSLCRTFNTVVPTVKTLTGAFEDLPNWLPGCVKAWISYLCPSILWTHYVKNGYRSFSDRCDLLMTPQNEAKLSYDKTLQEQLELLRDEAKGYFDDMIKMEKTCPLLNSHFIAKMQKLDKWRDNVLQTKGQLAFRKCPFVIAIYGPPNTGKSTMSTIIAQLLKPKSYPDANLIYPKSGIDEFWSGYKGQPFVLLDDFLALTEDTTLAEMMTAVSNVPLLLNMASVDNTTVGVKGTAFTSSCIIYTTNIPFPKIISLRCEKAFYRRRDVLVKLTVKPEYVDGKGVPQYHLIPEDVKANFTYLLWHLHDSLDADENAFLGQPMSTEEFFSFLLKKYHDHGLVQDEMLNVMKFNSIAIKVRNDHPHLVSDMTTHSVLLDAHGDDPPMHCEIHEVHVRDCRRCDLLEKRRLHECAMELNICPVHVTKYERVSCSTCQQILAKIDLSHEPNFYDAPESFTSRAIDATTDLLGEYYERAASYAHITSTNQSSVFADIVVELKDMKRKFYEAHPYIGKLVTFTGVVAAVGGVVYMVTKSLRSGLYQWKYEAEAKRVWPRKFWTNVENCENCDYDSFMDHSTPLCAVHQPECEIYEKKEEEILQKYRELGWIPTEGHVSGYNHDTPRRSRKAYGPPPKPVAQMQGHYSYTPVALNEVDVQGRSIVDNCVVPSLVSVWNKFGDNTGFMIAGRYMLTISHFFRGDDGEWIPEGTPFDVQIGENAPRFTQRFAAHRLFELPERDGRRRDAVVYELDGRVPASPDRRKHFMRRDEIGFIEGESGCVVSLKDGRLREYCFPRFQIEVRQNFRYTAHGKEFIIPNGLSYSSLTLPGDCGGPTVVLNKSLTRRICGIHACGHASLRISASEFVFFEDLEEALPNDTIVVGHSDVPHNGVVGDTLYRPPGFTILGSMPPKSCIPMASQTDIVKSPFHGCFGKALTKPSVLTPNDERLDPALRAVGYSPLANGLAKYSVMSGLFDETILDIVFEHLNCEWGFPNSPPRSLTEHEVLNGIAGKAYFDPINWNTSPGYPYKLLSGIKTKADCTALCEDGSRSISLPLLEQRWRERHALAKVGKRIDSLWIPCCKDERRSLEKIFSGSTRVFSNSSFDFVLFNRSLTLWFNANFYSSYHVTSSAVGMDCESEDWNEMISYLYNNSEEGFAGDFSRFDGTLSAQCVERFGEMMNSFYGDKRETERRVMIDEVIHPIYLAFGSIIQAHGGNPSGNPQTVVVNTVVNAAYLRYVWMLLAPTHMRSMAAFDTNVKFKVYGDDNIVSVRKVAQSFYNMQSVSRAFKTLGIVYLDSQKRETTESIVHLDSVTFLKRRNVTTPDILSCRYFGLMDQTTITEMIHWIRRCDDPLKAVGDNINMALLFAFFGGRKYFLFIRKRIEDFAKKMKLPIPSMYHYNELLIQWRTGKHVVNHWIDMESHSAPPPMALPAMETTEGSGGAGVGGSAAATITSDRGVTFADQQAPILQKIADGAHSSIQTRAQRTMPDISWQVTDMVEKVAPVGNYNWTTAQAPLTEIISFQLPFDAVTTNTVSIPFENFTFWRGDMEFQFKINGSAFQVGRLCVFYAPMLTIAQTRQWHLANKAAMTSGLHVYLDPSTNEPVNLLIPFTNINNHINCKARNPNYDFTGTLMVAVFNQLNASTGVSGTAGISVHVKYPKANFHLPQIKAFTTRRFDAKEDIARLEELVEKKNKRRDRDTVVYPDITEAEEIRLIALARRLESDRQRRMDGSSIVSIEEEDFLEMTPHGSSHSTENHNTYTTVTSDSNNGPSTGGGVINTAAANVTPIEIHNDNVGSQSNSQTQDISPKTDASMPAPMDKPSFGLNAPPALKRGVGMMSHAANIEWLQRLTLYQNSLNLSDTEHFGTTQDEMSLDYLFNKLTFFDYQNRNSTQAPAVWSASDAINTVIVSGNIGPCNQLLTMSFLTNPISFCDLQTFLTLKFTNWRGSMKYRFDVVCNSFQSGRLAFAAFYGETSVPATFSAKTCQYVFYMDVSAKNHSFTVELPYYFQRPWQKVPHGPLGSDPSAFYLGKWAIFVVTPLVHSDNTPSSVEINCFVGGGTNYRVMNVYDNNLSIIPMLGHGDAPKTGSVTLPSEILQRKDADLSTKPPVDIGTMHFGEQVRSIRDILKRYYPVGNYISMQQMSDPYDTHGYNFNFVDILGVIPIATCWTSGLAGYFGSMYRGCRGSMRLKIMVDLNRIAGSGEDPNWKTAWSTEARTAAFYAPSNAWWENADADIADNFRQLRTTVMNLFGSVDKAGNITAVANYLGAINSNITAAQSYVARGPYRINLTNLTGVDNGSHTTNSFPMDICDKYAPIHEIEIPFITQYEVLYNQVERTTDMFNDNYLYCHGTVVVAKISTAADDKNQSSDSFSVFAACGDDWHFGFFLGPHKIALQYMQTDVGPPIIYKPFVGDTYPNT